MVPMRMLFAGASFFDFNGLRCWAIVVLSFESPAVAGMTCGNRSPRPGGLGEGGGRSEGGFLARGRGPGVGPGGPIVRAAGVFAPRGAPPAGRAPAGVVAAAATAA